MLSRLEKLIDESLSILNKLLQSKYADYTGWIDLPVKTSKDELSEIELLASEIKSDSEVLVVVGVGGSYLGSKAVIEAMSSMYSKQIEVMYLGNSLSSLDLHDSLEYLAGKDFSVNIISKSGLTLEPALAFRFLRELMLTKYSTEETNMRTIITTGEGVLKEFAIENNIRTLSVPDDIGGRYSVLTAVGLLPVMVAGVNTERLLSGARAAFDSNTVLSKENPAVRHAASRINLMRKGKDIEVLAYYEPRLHYFAEWWKQLYGESEGKEGKGLFPASVCLTTDLHSLGQLIQDGKRNLFETHLFFNTNKRMSIPSIQGNYDNLDHLVGKNMDFVNQSAKEGTVSAHKKGEVPVIEIPPLKDNVLNEYSLGYLLYFFQLSCAISSCLMGVNPFNQPGVEAYKKNVTELLEREKVLAREKNVLKELAEKAGIAEWINSELVKGKDSSYFLDLVSKDDKFSKRINVCESNDESEVDKMAESYESALEILKADNK